MKCQTCSALCLIQSAVISLLIALFVFVVVPTQTYLGCPDLFDYSYSALLGAGLIGVLLTAVVGFGALVLLEKLIGQTARAVALAVLVCLYLETGVLSIGLPALNGVSGFNNLIRSGVDALAWLLVIGLFVIFRAPVMRNFKWFVASISLLIVASVFDAGGGSKVGVSSPLSEGFGPCYDVVRSIRFSHQRNVMVFILDMTPATIMTDVIERNPELKEKFPGFTCFRKNLCMHEETALGLPGLMTGRYFGEEDERGAYGMTVFGEDSSLYPYVAASNAVYYSGALHPYGYTNRLQRRKPAVDVSASVSRDECVLMRHSPSIPNFRMCDAMSIRLSPYFLKDLFFNRAVSAAAGYRPKTPGVLNEGFVFSMLEKSATSDETMTLSVVHTDSLHWPIKFDRDGKALARPLTVPQSGLCGTAAEPYREVMREAGVHVVRQLGKFFDALRKKGVYDNSTIILVADHGCNIMKEGENHGAESSILWVKPESGRGPFRMSDAPTTNAKIHDLVCRLRSSSLSAPEIESVLSQHDRVFRADYHGASLHAFGGKLHYKDWIYDDQSSLREIRQE